MSDPLKLNTESAVERLSVFKNPVASGVSRIILEPGEDPIWPDETLAAAFFRSE